jgi:methylated-DNA-[protein]-cysteine S-methyltransferase
MRNAQPETLTLDRVATPVGEVLLVTDGLGSVRALDFAGYEDRMNRLLVRHAPGASQTAGPPPNQGRMALLTKG